MRTCLAFLLAGLCATWLCACQGTRDVRTPNATAGCGTAVIVPENQLNRTRAAGIGGAPCGKGAVLVRICGQSLSGKSRFRVAAGPLTLQAAYKLDDTPIDEKVLRTRAVPISFTAVAGRTYAVRGQAAWSGARPTVTLWVVDGSTGQSVTSVVVPQENVIIEDEGFDAF
jgi:hypothetical protein